MDRSGVEAFEALMKSVAAPSGVPAIPDQAGRAFQSAARQLSSADRTALSELLLAYGAKLVRTEPVRGEPLALQVLDLAAGLIAELRGESDRVEAAGPGSRVELAPQVDAPAPQGSIKASQLVKRSRIR